MPSAAWLTRPAFVLAILGCILFSAFGSLYCSPRGYSGPADITIAPSQSIGIATSVIVAQEQGFFSRNGLRATVRDYVEGLNTLNALLNREVDIAGASEYPVVGKAFNKDDVRIIATTNKGGTFFIVGRKDRGIGSVTDLRGKRIGVTLKTINEFYFGRFLNLNGMQIGDVALVNYGLAQLEDALIGGNVDAVVIREPYMTSTRKRLGAGGISWPAQSGQPTYGIVAARGEWIKQDPDLVKRLVKSLAQAEDYVNKHPAETEAIILGQLNDDREALASFQAGMQFSLSLDMSLVAAMEDEARWMMNNGLTAERQVPDFLDYIYEDALKAIRPEAVNIIR